MNTIESLLERVYAQREDIRITKNPAWYRGQPDEKFRLSPSLMRIRNKRGLREEQNIFASFMTKATGLLPDSFDGGWDYLFLMQHHGVPTRLLDWTESLDVALFFACRDFINNESSDDDDYPNPALWVLNPYALNRETYGQPVVYDKFHKIPYDYYEEIKNFGTVPHCLPIAAQPTWFSNRVERQKGCFTIHGTNQQPLDAFGKNFIKKP